MAESLQEKVLDFFQSIGRKMREEGQGEWLKNIKREIDSLGKGANGWREALEEQLRTSNQDNS